MPQREVKKVLVVVRTYPLPATPGVEVSCTAGITADGKWIRLYPVPYRFLDEDKRFSKYQWIEVTVKKAASDARAESYNLDIDSIKILSKIAAAGEWNARKDVIFPLRSHCLCCLKKARDANGYPTLGIFRPRSIERLRITPDEPQWTQAQLEILRQGDLFQKAPLAELEKIPHKFVYSFHCDENDCPGHSLMCTDWELGQSWRAWSKKYGSEWETKFRQTYEQEMIEKKDIYFYVGTVHQHPHNWIIVGLFYPPKVKEVRLPLFDV